MNNHEVTSLTNNNSTKKELGIFYFITFLFSWAIWIPQGLVHSGVLKMNAYVRFFDANPFGAFGPLVGAILSNLLLGNGFKTAFTNTFRKFQKRWLILSAFILPVMWTIAILIANVIDGFNPVYIWSANPAMLIIIPLYIIVLGGPFEEEFGWRGFALPRWQNNYNSLVSGIITGFFWGLWHIPLYFIPSQTIYYHKPMWGLFISTILLSIIMIWIYNYTRSMFLMLVFHTAFNSSHVLIPVLENDNSSLVHMLLLFFFVVFIVWKFGVDLENKKIVDE